MAQVNPLTRELLVKLVYYGPGLGGKTTSLQHIHQSSPAETRGQIVSLATPVDRTLYFDFLPLRATNVRGHHVRLQLFTVPGQVYFNATRKLVLTGADGVVFVADSQRGRHDANLESLENLADNLSTQGRDLADVPLVFQYNKRDLAGVMSIEEMDESLNSMGAPAFATCASQGDGVLAALDALVQGVIDDLEQRNALGDDPKPLSEHQFSRTEHSLADRIGRASAELWTSDELEAAETAADAARAASVTDTDTDIEREESLNPPPPEPTPSASPRVSRDARTDVPPPPESVVPEDIAVGHVRSQSDSTWEEPSLGEAQRPAESDDEITRPKTLAPRFRDRETDVPPPPVASETAGTRGLVAKGPSWAPLFGEDAPVVRLVEADLAGGRSSDAVVRIDGLLHRSLERAARAAGMDESIDPVAVAAWLGVDAGRWIASRQTTQAARKRGALEARDALLVYQLLLEVRARLLAMDIA